MKLIAPDYYTKFQCIAGKCKHNCCIGWEIDIDEYTLSYYESIISGKQEEMPTTFIKRLSDGISYGEDTACFKLAENERCPFLNKDNLCDIILTLGEDSLCSICTDHPRFRNYFTDRTEVGLGLCCEEAARLILLSPEKSELIILGSDDGEEQLSSEEQAALDMRRAVYEILQNRSVTIEQRLKEMTDYCGAVLPRKSHTEWTDIFLQLERLDEKWGELLLQHREFALENYDFSIIRRYDTCFEQLAVYLTFRYFVDGALDGTADKTAAFISLCCEMIRNLFAAISQTADTADLSSELVELVRMFSAEVEYSDCNVGELMSVV